MSTWLGLGGGILGAILAVLGGRRWLRRREDRARRSGYEAGETAAAQRHHAEASRLRVVRIEAGDQRARAARVEVETAAAAVEERTTAAARRDPVRAARDLRARAVEPRGGDWEDRG